jgi:hypothetical protein
VIVVESTVRWNLINADGSVCASGETHNVITQVGLKMYSDRALALAGAAAAPTGMKLGTGTTAPSKTSAGAVLGVYLANSHQAFDSGFPSSALQGFGSRVTYKATFAAGKATSAGPITEAVIVNSVLTNATSSSADTVARVLLVGIPLKGAAQSLTVTWTHDFGTGT